MTKPSCKRHPPVSTLPKPINESEVLIDHGSTNIFRGTNGFPKIPTTQLLLGCCCCCCCCFFFSRSFFVKFRVLETIRVDFFFVGGGKDQFLLDGSDIFLLFAFVFLLRFFWGAWVVVAFRTWARLQRLARPCNPSHRRGGRYLPSEPGQFETTRGQKVENLFLVGGFNPFEKY